LLEAIARFMLGAMFSGRSAATSEKNALSSALCKMQATGDAYIDLTVSNPTAVALPFDDAAVARALGEASFAKYEPLPFGQWEARKAVADWYQAQGLAASVEKVVLTASTSESYSFLFTLLCDAGDEVLIPSPSYPLFEYLARFSAVQARPYRLQYDGAWHLDLSSVKAAISSRTRAIVVVNPNNPTGSCLTQSEWDELATLGLPLISDEVFARYPLHDATRSPISVLRALPAPAQPIFALEGLSKFAGLPQLKLGTIAFNAPGSMGDELCHRLELISDTFLSGSLPVQAALPRLLGLAPARNQLILARLRENLSTLRRTFDASAASLLRAQAGWSCVLRLPAVLTEEAWVLQLLERQRVLVQPGWFYDFAEEPFIVLSLLASPGVFEAGVRAVRASIDAA